MKDIPLNGRNWMELSLMVSGVTVNAVEFVPMGTSSSGKFQINVDGQQVTQNTAGAGFGQPQYSRDALFGAIAAVSALAVYDLCNRAA